VPTKFKLPQKMSVPSVVIDSKDYGNNIIEGYCIFCKGKITRADVKRDETIKIKNPNDPVGFSLVHIKHHVSEDMVY
jgi:hypothetical protein